jgi:conjugal transfer/entry exclusion protein
MIQIMQKRQRTIDEQSRYNAGSLDQITAHLADIKAKQEAKLAGLTADQQRTNYEDAAKIDLDREQSAKKIKDARFTPTRTKVKPSIIEIRPDPAPAAKPGEAASGKTDSLVGR